MRGGAEGICAPKAQYGIPPNRKSFFPTKCLKASNLAFYNKQNNLMQSIVSISVSLWCRPNIVLAYITRMTLCAKCLF